MKRISFTLLISLSCCWLAAQCPTDDVTFSTQGQIDSFPQIYPGCTKIPGNVFINDSSIVRLDSLYALKKIGGRLQIEHTKLSDLTGLENVDSIKGCLRILENPALVGLSGLENLHYVGGQTFIIAPSQYFSVGIQILGNPLLASLQSFKNLKTAPCLYISQNPSLSSLSGLDSISHIRGGNFADEAEYSIYLASNENLVTLEGLNSLDTAESDIIIESNVGLTSLTGLENLDFVKSWHIYANYSLSACSIPPLCAYLQSGGVAEISDNGFAPGCNSVAEVEAACMVSIEETSDGEPAVHFSPNPAGDFLQIQIKDPEKWEVSLYDLQGRQMFRQATFGSQPIWVKDWPSGLYTLRGVSDGRIFTRKIVKQ